jgi:hypothetical protein
MPKKPPTPMEAKPARPSPEELARRSVAKLDPGSGDRVRLVLRCTVSRATAEAISVAAITQEVNFATVVEEILEMAGTKLRKRAG